jgi:hypothetical protein
MINIAQRTVKYVLAGAFGLAAMVMAQTAPPITITSPANGAVVTPGQSVAVSVRVSSGSYPSGIAIIGQDPLGAVGPQLGSALTFNLTIPTVVAPGPYSVTAMGVNSAGALVSSTPVNLNVERLDIPTTLTVQPSSVNFRFAGDSTPLTVTGTFPGGMLLNITHSSQLTLTSANSSVATAQYGLVTATGPGTTNVSVRYGALTAQIPVTVPTLIRGDLNGDGRVDQSDLNIILAALNTPASGPNDARDLNHDGKINALDARILVTLCTNPGCATN